MATGIRKIHVSECASKRGGRCRCAGRWEASVWLPRERKRTYKYFPREADAKAWQSEANTAAKNGKLQSPTKLTVEQAAYLWLQGADSGAIRHPDGSPYKPSTLRGYRKDLRLRILPDLGAHKLTDLRRSDIQAFVERLNREGKSGSTVRNAVVPLQAICRYAMEDDRLGVNPTVGLRLPKAESKKKKSKRPKRIATAPEAAALIEALPSSDRALWATAFYAGLRRGELRGLRWSDVDLSGAPSIGVERSWDEVEGPGDPKTETGDRTVPILAPLRAHLAAHKLASGRSGGDLVFGRTPSAAFVASTVGNRAKAAWKEAELTPITLQECRHTFASLLIDAGANAKAIRTYMGHSSIKITFDTYGHLMPGNLDHTRELVDRYLAGAVG